MASKYRRRAEPWRKRLHSAVRQHAKNGHVSLDDIAYEAGVSPVTLSRVINGVNPRPSFETVVRIARAVGESVGYLAGEQQPAVHDEQALVAALDALRDSIGPLMRAIEARITAATRPLADAFGNDEPSSN
jgi:transcriptional regulator with XRE-family HTH domain